MEKSTALILAGGRSSRMGRDKAALIFGGQSLAARLFEEYSRYLDRVLFSVARGADFEFDFICDELENAGPLAGLHAVFTKTDSERVFLSAVDLPFGSGELALRLLELSEGYDACAIRRESTEPAFAVYSRAVLPLLEDGLRSDRRSLRALLERAGARLVGAEELPGFDLSRILFNMNSPEDYRTALATLAEDSQNSS